MKKFIAILLTFGVIVSVSGFCFADYAYVDSSLTQEETVLLNKGEEVRITCSVNTASYEGKLVEIPLVGFQTLGTQNSSCVWFYDHVGVSWYLDSVTDSGGLPIPYTVTDNAIRVVIGRDFNQVNFTIVAQADSLQLNVASVIPHAVLSDMVGSAIATALRNAGIEVKNAVTVNQSCNLIVHGDTSQITLADLLGNLDYSMGEIDSTLQVMRQYLYWVQDEATESNGNLTNIIDKLEWIVSEMAGNSGAAMGQYDGYNYSQLFVEMINAIKNISIGDISGNITVQTDLSEVINNLVTVANAYNNINQFDYTGKMYFRPVSVVARQYVTEGTPKIVNPTIEYHTMVGLPSYTLGSVQGITWCDTLNMKMGIGSNTTFPLMPGRYRFRIRVLTPANISAVGSMAGTQVYFYNTQLGWLSPEWNSTADQYNSGFITHSCEFVIDVPAGNYPGSLQFSNSGGALLLGSKFTVEVTDLDRTQTDILASTQRIEQLVARNNELLAGLTGTVENDSLSDAMQDFDGYENDAQTNFEDHMTVVDDAMSTITGVTTSDYMTSVVSFINGNFTSIWEALGRFKYLIILNLLAGLALVFVGRSGKVK